VVFAPLLLNSDGGVVLMLNDFPKQGVRAAFRLHLPLNATFPTALLCQGVVEIVCPGFYSL